MGQRHDFQGQQPSTTVDTEHGFLGSLKAIWIRIRRFLQAGIIAGKCRAGRQSRDPGGQDGAYGARNQGGWVLTTRKP
jgi:hypothetical protein